MRNNEVRTGGRYLASVSGRVVVVRIVRESLYGSGWTAINEATGRTLHLRSARRLREEVRDG